jgi:hypothetical protein
MQKIVQAISEPHRREILRLVQDRELSAGEIATRFDVTRPAISQHLTVLKSAGTRERTARGTASALPRPPRGACRAAVVPRRVLGRTPRAPQARGRAGAAERAGCPGRRSPAAYCRQACLISWACPRSATVVSTPALQTWAATHKFRISSASRRRWAPRTWRGACLGGGAGAHTKPPSGLRFLPPSVAPTSRGARRTDA